MILALFPSIDTIRDFFLNMIHTILLFIDQLAYSLIGFIYRIFLILANFDPFKVEVYEAFVTRIYTLLGVVMLFILVYNLLQGIIDPDKMEKSDAAPQKFLLNIVVSIILVAILPTIFEFISNLQVTILNQNVVQNVIFGADTEEATNASTAQAGYEIAMNVFSPFFQVTDDWCEQVIATYNLDENNPNYNNKTDLCEDYMYTEDVYDMILDFSKGDEDGEKSFLDVDEEAVQDLIDDINEDIETAKSYSWALRFFYGIDVENWHTIENLDIHKFSLYNYKQAIKSTGDFDRLQSFSRLTFKSRYSDGIRPINHMFPVSTIAAVFVCYVLISFCFDLGKRVVKLLFLQVIAPIPAIARAMPKGKDIFDKWLKKLIAVYLEVFARLVALFFGIFLIQLVVGSYSADAWERFAGEGGFIVALAKAFVIMGIIAFIKELPKFLGEIFPAMNSDGMSLGIKDKFKAGGGFVAGGAVGGGVTSGVRNYMANRAKIKELKKKDPETGKSKWDTMSGREKASMRMHGVTSAAAGTVSGAVRGGVNAKDAGNMKDMKKAASSAAQTTAEKRNKRQEYRANHGNSFVGVAKGHVMDAMDSIGRWAGINNVEELERKNAQIKSIQDKDADHKKTTEELLKQDAAKGKNFTYGATGSFAVSEAAKDYLADAGLEFEGEESEGKLKYSTANLLKLQQKLDAASSRGDDQAVAALSEAFGMYLKNFTDQVRNMTLKSKENWDKFEKELTQMHFEEAKAAEITSKVTLKIDERVAELGRDLNDEEKGFIRKSVVSEMMQDSAYSNDVKEATKTAYDEVTQLQEARTKGQEFIRELSKSLGESFVNSANDRAVQIEGPITTKITIDSLQGDVKIDQGAFKNLKNEMERALQANQQAINDARKKEAERKSDKDS